MANVLNEFLSGVSKGFADAAFASYSRRRSTVRDDINQTFGGEPEEGDVKAKPAAASPGQSYLDMLNTPDASSTAALPAPKPKAAAKPAAKPAAKAKAPASRSKGKDALKEI
jgi:hypothetical protein